MYSKCPLKCTKITLQRIEEREWEKQNIGRGNGR